MKKGKEYLSSVINESITIELSAVDLHNLNCDIEKFKKGDLVRVISIPHKLDRYFLVSKLSLSLDDPKSSKLTLGQTFSTLTQRQLDKDKEIKNTVYNINYTVNKEVKNISDVKEEVKNINNTVIEIPTEYVKTAVFNLFKEEINKKVGRVYTIKGSVASYNVLLSLNAEIGDVYNCKDTGANYVFTEEGWDKFSEDFDFSIYLTGDEADNKFATITNLNELIARVEKLENKGGTN